MMKYKGYIASIEYDEDSKSFHGRIVNLRDVVTFEGTTVQSLKRQFALSVKDYLEMCREDGVEPDDPNSCEIDVTVDPRVHLQLALAAEKADVSFNEHVTRQLEKELKRRKR